jgi:hypothetical protein
MQKRPATPAGEAQAAPSVPVTSTVGPRTRDRESR